MNASKVELTAILFQALTAGSLFLYKELNDTPSISIICFFLVNANIWQLENPKNDNLLKESKTCQ